MGKVHPAPGPTPILDQTLVCQTHPAESIKGLNRATRSGHNSHQGTILDTEYVRDTNPDLSYGTTLSSGERHPTSTSCDLQSD